MDRKGSSYTFTRDDLGESGAMYFDFYSQEAKRSPLDEKTLQLVYLAYLSSAGILDGVRKHTGDAKAAGATREEIQSVFRLGLHCSGAKITESYRVAMEAYDSV